MRLHITVIGILSVLSFGRLASAQPTSDRPHIVACGPRAFAGQTLCVCGNFSNSSANALLLDGKPMGQPVTISESSLTFRIPETVGPGLQTVTGSPEAGFSPAEAVVTTVLELAPEIDQKAMLRGQWTRARFKVRGTTSPIRLRITNRTPDIVSVEGGPEQILMTSGGPDNGVIRRVHALSRGDFSIQVELAGQTCPCMERQAVSRARTVPAPPGLPAGAESEDPRGFLNARVAAMIPLAAAPAMAATAQALAAANGLVVAEVTPLQSTGDALIVFTVPNAADVLAVAAALGADPRVRLAEPDFVFATSGVLSPQEGATGTLKYGARLMHLDRLNPSLTGKDVPVAVIDTGVDSRHPALAGRLKLKTDVTATSYAAGIHGTLVAGIVADLAPRASLLSIQACIANSEQSIAARCSSVTLLKALNLAIERRARVINMSLGGPHSRLVERVIDQAVRNGALVVAAAGNSGPAGTPSFPAVLQSVMAVTAVDAAQALYPYAATGSFIDLAAPGVDILSAAPGGQVLVFSGTSAAAPHVSAIAALMLEKQRNLSPATAQQLLETGAQDLGPAGKDPNFGSGLVDGCRTLAQLLTSPACR